VAAYELEVRKTTVGAVAVVELTGEIDLTNADELQTRLEALAIDASGLVVDLNRVTFVDSAALHVLFRLGRQLHGDEKGYGVVLEASAPVSKTIELVRLEEAAQIGGTVEDVLAHLPS
jgi:anti-anti-sigma factor